nr:hypothetical protein [Tanacetum cinerariifolium]
MFDFLLEEFSGKLAHINSIPPRIEEADFDLEEEIHLVENLLYGNSSPRPSKELNAKIVDTIVESLSPSPIPVEDSDSQMEEIDLFLDTDDLIPPGIESDDYDSEGDIYFLEELLSNDTLSLLRTESFHLDHHDDLSFPLPPSKPSDIEIFFDFKPNTGILTTKVAEDISEHHVLMPKVLPSQPALCLILDTLLLFSSENEDKVFKLGILSFLLVSHQDKAIFCKPDDGVWRRHSSLGCSISLFLSSLTKITPDLEASRACGFVHRPLKLQSLAYGNLIS